MKSSSVALTKQERKFQSEQLLPALKAQGFFASATNDMFKAGKPDFRLARRDLGQLDVELKYSIDLWEPGKQYDTGLVKLQELRMKDMNKAGMPCIGLVYVVPLELFFVTTVLRDTLPGSGRCVAKFPKPAVIAGEDMFNIAMRHLYGLGYRYPASRHWG